MFTWMEVTVLNALGATALAVAAWASSRVWRRPGLTHALWVLVLLKLISFPLIEFDVAAWLPAPQRWTTLRAPDAGAAPTTASELGRHEFDAVRSGTTLDTATRALDEGAHAVVDVRDADERFAAMRRYGVRVVAGVAAAGTMLLLLLALLRARRFRRRLRHTARPAPALQQRARQLGAALGMGRAPAVSVVDATIPPSLVPTVRGGCEILLPSALVSRLEPNELDTLLVHELTHARRRDHWMRILELFAGALYWWHPVVWWARRNLRIAEEQCCDLAVKTRFPHQARAYARGLLKTVEFLSEQDDSMPALATGAGESSRLEERVTMILKHEVPRPLSRRLRALLLALALVSVVVSPAWMDERVDAAVSQASASSDESEMDREREAVELRMLELEQERLQLERQFAELEFERMQVRSRLEAAEAELQVERLREELQRLEDATETQAAELVRQRLEIFQRETALRREKLEFEQRHARLRMDLDLELRSLELDLRRAYVGEDEAHVRELEKRVLQLRQRQQELELQGMRDQLNHERRKLELERAQLEKTRAR